MSFRPAHSALLSNKSAAAPTSTSATRRVPARETLLSQNLEGLRTRLATLATSLNDFHGLVATSPVFPPWTVLQSRAANIASNAAAVAEHLALNHSLFTEGSVFPLPNFPLQTEPMGFNVLTSLLRKKLEPGIEDWLVEARKVGEAMLAVKTQYLEGTEDRVLVAERNPRKPTFEDWNKFWGGESKEVGNHMRYADMWGGAAREFGRMFFALQGELTVVDYTREERERGVENVNTGLKRELRADPVDVNQGDEMDDDDDSGDDEDDDELGDQMAVDLAPEEQPPLDMNAYLKFINTGVMPEPPAKPAAPFMA